MVGNQAFHGSCLKQRSRHSVHSNVFFKSTREGLIIMTRRRRKSKTASCIAKTGPADVSVGNDKRESNNVGNGNVKMEDDLRNNGPNGADISTFVCDGDEPIKPEVKSNSIECFGRQNAEERAYTMPDTSADHPCDHLNITTVKKEQLNDDLAIGPIKTENCESERHVKSEDMGLCPENDKNKEYSILLMEPKAERLSTPIKSCPENFEDEPPVLTRNSTTIAPQRTSPPRTLIDVPSEINESNDYSCPENLEESKIRRRTASLARLCQKKCTEQNEFCTDEYGVQKTYSTLEEPYNTIPDNSKNDNGNQNDKKHVEERSSLSITTPLSTQGDGGVKKDIGEERANDVLDQTAPTAYSNVFDRGMFPEVTIRLTRNIPDEYDNFSLPESINVGPPSEVPIREKDCNSEFPEAVVVSANHTNTKQTAKLPSMRTNPTKRSSRLMGMNNHTNTSGDYVYMPLRRDSLPPISTSSSSSSQCARARSGKSMARLMRQQKEIERIEKKRERKQRLRELKEQKKREKQMAKEAKRLEKLKSSKKRKEKKPPIKVKIKFNKEDETAKHVDFPETSQCCWTTDIFGDDNEVTNMMGNNAQRDKNDQRKKSPVKSFSEDDLSNKRLEKHACLLWSSEQRRRFQQEHPSFNLEELDNVMRDHWGTLTDREKARYFQRARNAIIDRNKHSMKRQKRTGTQPKEKKVDKEETPNEDNFFILSSEQQQKIIQRKLEELRRNLSRPEYELFIQDFKRSYHSTKETIKMRAGNYEAHRSYMEDISRRLLYIRLKKYEPKFGKLRERKAKLLQRRLCARMTRLVDNILEGKKFKSDPDTYSPALEQLMLDLEDIDIDKNGCYGCYTKNEHDRIQSIVQSLKSKEPGLKMTIDGRSFKLADIKNKDEESEILCSISLQGCLPELDVDAIEEFFDESQGKQHATKTHTSSKKKKLHMQAVSAWYRDRHGWPSSCCSLESPSCLVSTLVAADNVEEDAPSIAVPAEQENDENSQESYASTDACSDAPESHPPSFIPRSYMQDASPAGRSATPTNVAYRDNDHYDTYSPSPVYSSMHKLHATRVSDNNESYDQVNRPVTPVFDQAQSQFYMSQQHAAADQHRGHTDMSDEYCTPYVVRGRHVGYGSRYRWSYPEVGWHRRQSAPTGRCASDTILVDSNMHGTHVGRSRFSRSFTEMCSQSNYGYGCNPYHQETAVYDASSMARYHAHYQMMQQQVQGSYHTVAENMSPANLERPHTPLSGNVTI